MGERVRQNTGLYASDKPELCTSVEKIASDCGALGKTTFVPDAVCECESSELCDAAFGLLLSLSSQLCSRVAEHSSSWNRISFALYSLQCVTERMAMMASWIALKIMRIVPDCRRSQ